MVWIHAEQWTRGGARTRAPACARLQVRTHPRICAGARARLRVCMYIYNIMCVHVWARTCECACLSVRAHLFLYVRGCVWLCVYWIVFYCIIACIYNFTYLFIAYGFLIVSQVQFIYKYLRCLGGYLIWKLILYNYMVSFFMVIIFLFLLLLFSLLWFSLIVI